MFAILAGVTLATGWGLEFFRVVPEWVAWWLLISSCFFGGFFALGEAVEKLRAGKFEIDFLMLVAAAGAGALGHLAEGALLLFLFSLGHALEHHALGRARRAIAALGQLAPTTALVRRDGETEEVDVNGLVVGDRVIVKAHSKVSADGFVVAGESSVDQSPVTGESVPVDKRPVMGEEIEASLQNPATLDAAHVVFAGTINGGGVLEVVVTKRAEDNTLARVVKLVTEAESQRSPTQRFADRFQRVYVPAVLVFVIALLMSPIVTGEALGDAFYRAMAVLVGASPCALAISTPSAVLSGVARAGRSGVLVKGGGPLENLGTIDAVAFDKTGTVTRGEPELTDVVASDGVDDRELLTLAAAVERLSDHPLARAVVREVKRRFPDVTLPHAERFESLTGRGVRANFNGDDVFIGRFDIDHPSDTGVTEAQNDLEKQGRTTMIVRRGGRVLGVLGLMDTPRDSAPGVVTRLHGLGLRPLVMISGDHQRVVDTVAERIGVDTALGDLLPEDKVDAVRRLRDEHGRVAMVGDGVNDAPAMAAATVGIAMGAAGSDVALETADVALMADDLRGLPFAFALGRQTNRIIRQNLWISLGMVAVLVPAALLGLRLGPAVALHEGSTVVVVLNALRLLRFDDGDSGST